MNEVAELPKSEEEIKKLVIGLEGMMMQLPQLELRVDHFFSPGIYTRALYIPKGCLLTGKIHNEPILNIMIQGDISVFVEGEIKRIKAPYMLVSPAGSKKIGYAHEDTIWVGCHGTDETDLVKIEERFVSATEEDYLKLCDEQRQLLEAVSCG